MGVFKNLSSRLRQLFDLRYTFWRPPSDFRRGAHADQVAADKHYAWHSVTGCRCSCCHQRGW